MHGLESIEKMNAKKAELSRWAKVKLVMWWVGQKALRLVIR